MSATTAALLVTVAVAPWLAFAVAVIAANIPTPRSTMPRQSGRTRRCTRQSRKTRARRAEARRAQERERVERYGTPRNRGNR